MSKPIVSKWKIIAVISLIFIADKFSQPTYETQYPFHHDWKVTGPTINIKKLGARGDGVTNDSTVFRMAAALIENAGSGKLIIPAGLYIVGEEEHVDSSAPYWKSKDIFRVRGVNGLIIKGGKGAVIRKSLQGFHFGSFSPGTGKAYQSTIDGFTDHDYRADGGGPIFNLSQSQNILISNLEIDGSSDSYTFGGWWGNRDHQCNAVGITLNETTNVLLRNLYLHHHGLDGIEIITGARNDKDPPAPHILEKVTSSNNGRQGLSWNSGPGLTAWRCNFNHNYQDAGFSLTGLFTASSQ